MPSIMKKPTTKLALGAFYGYSRIYFTSGLPQTIEGQWALTLTIKGTHDDPRNGYGRID